MRAAAVCGAAAASLFVAGCQEPAPSVQEPPASEAPAPPSDEEVFAARMSDVDFYVMEAARLAEGKAGAQEVRALARELLREQEVQARALEAALAAHQPKIELSPAPPDDKLALLETLSILGPESFDKAYVDQQISAQEHGVNSLRLYAETGREGPLKAYAVAALPAAESRLARVREARLELLALLAPPA